MGYYKRNKDSIDLITMLVVVTSAIIFSHTRIPEKELENENKISWSTSDGTSTEVQDWIDKNKVDSIAINLIKKSEGFNPNWKRCPKGVKTIGYGFTRMKWKSKMTRPVADSILLIKYNGLQLDIQKALGTTKVKDNQLAALTVFSYNVGFNAFLESSLFRCLKKEKIHRIDKEFKKWVYIKVDGKVKFLKGLKRRRLKEIELWKMELS